MIAVEKMLERLLCDAEYRDRYLADPDECMSEAGVPMDMRSKIKAIDLRVLQQGTYPQHRRVPSLNHDAVKGGTVV